MGMGLGLGLGVGLGRLLLEAAAHGVAHTLARVECAAAAALEADGLDEPHAAAVLRRLGLACEVLPWLGLGLGSGSGSGLGLAKPNSSPSPNCTPNLPRVRHGKARGRRTHALLEGAREQPWQCAVSVLGRHRAVVAAGGRETGHERMRAHGDGKPLLRPG